MAALQIQQNGTGQDQARFSRHSGIAVNPVNTATMPNNNNLVPAQVPVIETVTSTTDDDSDAGGDLYETEQQPPQTQQQCGVIEVDDCTLLNSLTHTLTEQVHEFDKSIEAGRQWLERLDHRRAHPKVRPCKALDNERRDMRNYWKDSGLQSFVTCIVRSIVKRPTSLPYNATKFIEQAFCSTTSAERHRVSAPSSSSDLTNNLQSRLCAVYDENDALKLRIRACLNKLRSAATLSGTAAANPTATSLLLKNIELARPLKDVVFDQLEQFAELPILAESDIEKYLCTKFFPHLIPQQQQQEQKLPQESSVVTGGGAEVPVDLLSKQNSPTAAPPLPPLTTARSAMSRAATLTSTNFAKQLADIQELADETRAGGGVPDVDSPSKQSTGAGAGSKSGKQATVQASSSIAAASKKK